MLADTIADTLREYVEGEIRALAYELANAKDADVDFADGYYITFPDGSSISVNLTIES